MTPTSDLVLSLPANAGEMLTARLDRLATTDSCGIAYTFLSQGRAGDCDVTYAELANRAKRFASGLAREGKPGDRVLLLLPPGYDYVAAFLGCVYSGRIAVPLFPPKAGRENQRIDAVASTAAATLAITPATGRPAAAQILESCRTLPVDWFDTQSVATDWREPVATDTCYLQYTSGSTRDPKGVMVSHGNLLYNLRDLCEGWKHTPSSRMLSWLPPFHDMGLIYGLLAPLFGHFHACIMAPAAFLQRPARWLQEISRHRITHSIAPNFAYDICSRKVSEEECAGLDLTSWRVAVNGSEPIQQETLRRFAEKFAPYGFDAGAFSPGYGLAEATLKVCAVGSDERATVLCVDAAALDHGQAVPCDAQQVRSRELTGCGRPALETVVRIVDPQTGAELAEDCVGEVWVSGPSVAQGYWGDPVRTDRVFQATTSTGEGPFLRTGDLGFLHNGELFVTGRLKDLIIVAGRNHYPQDIEYTVQLCDAALRPSGGSAFAYQNGKGTDQLAIVQEVDLAAGDERCADLLERVRVAVAREHGVAADAIVFIEPRSLPKTTSGKVQRSRTRDLFVGGELRVIAEWHAGTEIEDAGAECVTTDALLGEMLRIVAEALRMRAAAIGLDVPVTRLGLSSLIALEICHRVELLTGCAIPAGELLRGMSVRELAEWVKSANGRSHGVAQGAAIVDGDYPATAGQRALLLLDSLADVAGVYNVACALQVRGELVVDSLQAAWNGLANRHDVLRCCFPSEAEGVLRVDSRLTPEFHVVDGLGWDTASRNRWIGEQAHARFRTDSAVPARLSVLRTASEEWTLVVTMHHAISDLWSMSLLVEELFALYREAVGGVEARLAAPAPLGEHLKATADELSGERGRQLREHWFEELRGELPALELPLDHARPATQSFRGKSIDFRIPAALAEKAAALAQAHNTTTAVVLLAAYQLLLGKSANQDEVVVGVPSSGRTAARTRALAGYLVNTLPIRVRWTEARSFVELVRKVQAVMSRAVDAQDFPFASMAQQIAGTRDAARPPVFQASFAFQHAAGRCGQALAQAAAGSFGTLPIDGFDVTTVDVPVRTSPFDLTLFLAETGTDIAARLVFNTTLFETTSAEGLTRRFTHLLGRLLDTAESALDGIGLVSGREADDVLRDWNATERAYNCDKPLHLWIEEQARRTPEAIAVADEYRQLTYAELLAASRRVAVFLASRGIGPEALVGVCMERCADLVTALLGILRCGAAYVPLSPGDPLERLRGMAAQAGCRVVLTQEHLMRQLGGIGCRLHAITDVLSGNSASVRSVVLPEVLPDNAAYAIFTSGSTGNPKCAVNTHRGIVNRLLWMQERLQLRPDDRVLQKTPITFDVSVWEFFWPLMTGASIVMAKPGGHQDPHYLADCIQRFGVTVLHFVPSMMRLFLEEPAVRACPSVRMVCCSGEALPRDLTEKFFAVFPCELHNLYGPTEASVDVTHWECAPADQTVPIGRPVANTRMYVLDRHLNPLPAKVTGELYIAGVQLARGYHGRMDLTAERFIPCPFGAPGERMYRTGDVGRWREDGAIEYQGRVDHQVKIRGCRIELGEVEAACLRHHAVNEAVVVTQSGTAGMDLVAYVVMAPGEAATTAAIKESLRQTLPDYMVPAGICPLPAMPLLANGKVNRAALPRWTPGSAERVAVEPASETESKLAAVCAEVFSLPHVGVMDDFFELGVHSLLLARLALQVRLAFGVTVPNAVLFQSPNVRQLAARIDELRSKGGGISRPILAKAERTTSCIPSAERAAQCEQATSIVAIPTADRPRDVLRCVESWAGQSAFRRTGSSIAVFDGAAESGELRNGLRSLSRQTGVAVEYCGPQERRAFAGALAQVADAPPSVIEFALFGDDLGLPATGSNRNAILLHGAGRKLLSVDDDTICRMAPAPGQRNEWSFSSEPYPPQVTALQTRDEIWTQLDWGTREPLTELDRVLGKSVDALGLPGEGSVRVAVFGSAGDCGWSGPGNYLFLSGASLERMCASEASYLAATASREVIQAVPHPVATSRPAHVMSMFIGFDGTYPMPPFLPVGRGQDEVFGATLSLVSCGKDLLAYLPWVLPHLASGRRSFARRDILRAASGLSLSHYMSLAQHRVRVNGATPVDRMQSIGSELERIGNLPAGDFAEYTHRIGQEHARALAAVLEQRMMLFREATAWRDDASRFLHLLRESSAHAGFGTPLDLLYSRTEAEALAATQRLVRQWGSLLIHWPELLKGVLALRDRGDSLTRRI